MRRETLKTSCDLSWKHSKPVVLAGSITEGNNPSCTALKLPLSAEKPPVTVQGADSEIKAADLQKPPKQIPFLLPVISALKENLMSFPSF